MNATPSDVEREAIRRALLAIVERNNGVLNPAHVLEAARDEEHVLHRFFEWDDAKAGDAYRLAQVGALVRRLRLTIIRPATAPREVAISTTRSYQSRPSMRGQGGGYEGIGAILSDDEKRGELLAQVLRELSAYRRRYAELSELQTVWIAVDDALEASAPAGSSSLAPGAEARHGAAG